MIAIDVTMTLKEINFDFNVDDTVVLIEQSYQNVYDFFQRCLARNLLLNATVNMPTDDTSSAITRYFATTNENALAFEQVFSDMSAEFSMKKFWDQHGFNISIAHSEIDFDTVNDTVELIGTFGEIWGIEFQK